MHNAVQTNAKKSQTTNLLMGPSKEKIYRNIKVATAACNTISQLSAGYFE